MAGEPNQAKWVGIRPTDPAENIPVEVKAVTGNTPIIPATPEKIFTYREPPEGCTYVIAYADKVNGDEVVYEVPANTIFYLTDYDFSVDATAAGKARLSLHTDAPVVLAFPVYVTVATNVGFAISHNYTTAIQLPAGYTVQIYSQAAGITVFATIVGYTRPV